MESKEIVGYLTPLTARPGDKVEVKVSTVSENYHASLVQLICGDSRKRGTGYQDRTLPAEFTGSYSGRQQDITPGSYAYLGRVRGAEAFGVGCWLFPTTPDNEQTQVVVSGPQFAIQINAGRLSVHCRDAIAIVPLQLAERRWHQLLLSTGGGRLRVRLEKHGHGSGERDKVLSECDVSLADTRLDSGDWWLATRDARAGGQFNGRIESPVIAAVDKLETLASLGPNRADDRVLAGWDFSLDMASDRFSDLTGHTPSGQFFQQPTRAVTGHLWDGSVQRWRDQPGHYGAVHFHLDDLVDVNWQTDFEFEIPKTLPSGLYGIKLSLPDGEEDLMPLFVAPAQEQPKKGLALLMSTATYLAYANQRLSIGEGQFGGGAKSPADQYLLEHPEVGNSLYEHHLDGSGVHFSSYLRPVLNLRPRVTPWAFNADTNLTAWFDAIDQPFDIITDELLHQEGSELLGGYQAVVTCTHPEYYSSAMLAGLSDWLAEGGRLMYMGGNGFYWRIAYHPENPAIIEVRRAEDGTRAWMAEPGEYYHQFSGEYGGLWRRLGHPPNKMVGVGFAAQGFDGGTYYRLQSGALDSRVGFMMEGLEESEFIGQHGTQGGGAAGEEIDRFDPSLGSPNHALVIASSENHRPGMLRAKEEFHMTVAIPRDQDVRADITFFETPGGGAVFSTGSISYAGSLSTNSYDNDIARLTGNVLKRFLDPEPFAYPDSTVD